jgi:hypothetical protein
MPDALRGLARRVAHLPGMGRPAALARRLLRGTPDPGDPDGMYGQSYFGAGRDGRSGYERYDRIMSNSDFAAFLIWRHFDVRKTLEVGAAMGYLVESLRELDIEAWGVDVSNYAVEHGSPAAMPYLRQNDLRDGLPFADGEYDMVIALETLEHIPPAAIPSVLRELARATNAWVVCTIPSFGHNRFGPDGFFSGKIRPERLAHYESLPDDYLGPVPDEDLMLDDSGQPIEGHICIAAFEWWTARFAEAGLERAGEIERRVHVDIADLGFTNLWDTYVFCKPGTPLPAADLRNDAEADELRTRWQLYDRRPGQRCG